MREDFETHCQRCGAIHMRSDLYMSHDCHGIPFRLVCEDCLDEIDEIGYDGALYSEFDECLDEDY